MLVAEMTGVPISCATVPSDDSVEAAVETVQIIWSQHTVTVKGWGEGNTGKEKNKKVHSFNKYEKIPAASASLLNRS